MTVNAAAWMKAFQHEGKGATLTRVRSSSTWSNLTKFAKERRMILAPDKMTSKQLFQYVEWRNEAGIAARTIQGEVSHIRRSMRGAGRDLGDLKDKKNNWSSHRLQSPKGSRVGTAPPAPENALELASKAGVRADALAVFGLEQMLGLRMAEAIQSGPSLKFWMRDLELAKELGRDANLTVEHGTKGGKVRTVSIPMDRIEAVIEAVQAAQKVSFKVDGSVRLVDSKNLESAKHVMHRAAKSAGFNNHGLRRAWAVQQFASYAGKGYDKDGALARLCGDLGHGDGRGRWAFNNYLRGAEDGAS